MRTRIFPLHVITVVSLWPWKKNLCSSSFTHILRLQVLHWRSVFGEQVWITKSSQAISPTMKSFILSFLVLTSLCFVLGDEDEIKPNFDDLNANDGQMFEDSPDDYVEDEEDNVSSIKFIWIRAEFIVNWRFVINIVLKNSDFNAREFIMTNCYPNKSCEIESVAGETTWIHTELTAIFTYQITVALMLIIWILKIASKNVFHLSWNQILDWIKRGLALNQQWFEKISDNVSSGLLEARIFCAFEKTRSFLSVPDKLSIFVWLNLLSI